MAGGTHFRKSTDGSTFCRSLTTLGKLFTLLYRCLQSVKLRRCIATKRLNRVGFRRESYYRGQLFVSDEKPDPIISWNRELDFAVA